MEDGARYVPQLPAHPELRDIALAIESAGMMGEILDAKFRCVFISTETARAIGVSAGEADSMIGISTIALSFDERAEGIVRVTEESGAAWFEHNAPIMRRYLEPGDPEFEEVFGPAAKLAEQTDPIETAPRAWHDTVPGRRRPPGARTRARAGRR